MTRDDIGWLPRAQRIDAGQITSREVVEVAAAEQVFAEREAVARDLRNTARVVTRLGLLGVDAAQISRHLVVRDIDALDALLDRIDSALGERAL